jgi:hypothetical protein
MLVRHPRRLLTQADVLLGVWVPKAAGKTVYPRVRMTALLTRSSPIPRIPGTSSPPRGLGVRFDPDGGASLAVR